ncbi:hypothetical protein [Mangrovibrevibacter kandeliae]|uniref:hypothetical protein n=1 Tax=Mangrovibrevibacter kandeliae TaxID=2968473 RepID=UPI002119ADC1|nr:hypothetical protein [Aurantimonas sp. CSK15Z-1]MCQ8781485.1 hypothetical protein [Aurantimonas sp. CSK15Z-1]
MPRQQTIIALAAASLLGLGAAAQAQTSAPAPDTQAAPGLDAAPPSVAPDAGAPGAPDLQGTGRCDPSASGGDNASRQLADCGGVLTPPGGVDPQIQAPAPDPNPGTTPVIPPGAVPEQPAETPK